MDPSSTSGAAVAGLEPLNGSLNRRHAAHLLRRTGFGVRTAWLDRLVGMDARSAAALVLEEETGAPMPPAPSWQNELPPPSTATDEEKRAYQQRNGQYLTEFRRGWYERLWQGGLRERMTLFWHNHFVTELGAYNNAPFAYRYVTLLRSDALGSYSRMVQEIGKDAAMLQYLNGTQNLKGRPNENYARELLELFTMSPSDAQGRPNYTQKDIEEIARALTGWQVDRNTLTVKFSQGRFDTGTKTFLGRTGAFGYDDVIRILFETRSEAIAYHICEKIYREFVYHEPDSWVVQAMAGVFLFNQFQIGPVLRALLASAHFYEERFVGARLKSPVEMLNGFLLDVNAGTGSDMPVQLERYATQLGQRLLSPPNVAGWPGYHQWLNTTTLPTRWFTAETFLSTDKYRRTFDMAGLSRYLLSRRLEEIDPALASLNTAPDAFRLPLMLAAHFLSVPLPRLVLEPVSDDFAQPTTVPAEIRSAPVYLQTLAKVFLAGVPWYEWGLDKPGAPALLFSFARYLTQLPEYQLT